MGLDNKRQQHIYDKYWVEIEKNTTEELSKSNNMSDFIRDYLTFKFSSIPVQNKVFEVFREKYQLDSFDELTLVLEDLKKYSKYYSYLINPDTSPSNLFKQNLKLIKKLQINVSYPFLLQVFNAYNEGNINGTTLNEVLEIIQSFTWRRFICGVATNALNKIFMDLYKNVDESDFINSLYKNLIVKSGSQRFPKDEEVLKELRNKDMYNIQPKNRTYFLERLENYGYTIQTNIENNYDVTIEHIFPQKPNNDWKQILGVDFDEMKKFTNTAVNLTLSAFNSELSNSIFCVKRDLPEKGYKFSPLRMDKYLAELDDWNLNTLNTRWEWIEQRFLKIWKYPSIEINFDNSNDEVNILDIDHESVKYHEIEYYKFFDVKYENPSFQHLFKTVSTIMFEREPQMFMDTELKEKLKLTQDKSILRNAMQVSPTFYIESNLSASHIVNRVHRILNICETDDDLVIKLKKS